MVLDLDELARGENENWVWHGASFLRPACRRCLLFLSRGGADAEVVREFDVTTKSFVKEASRCPRRRAASPGAIGTASSWARTLAPDSLTHSGYPRLVKEWKRGTPPAEARLVFEGRPEDVSVSGYRTQTPGYQREFVSRGITTWENELFLRRNGQLTPDRETGGCRGVHVSRSPVHPAAHRVEDRRPDLPCGSAARRRSPCVLEGRAAVLRAVRAHGA